MTFNTSAAAPFLTVIVPCRNERRYVERTLRSVLAASWPPGRMEVLVVDGMSDDGTRETVAALAAADARVRLLDNPGRFAGDAMNVGIAAARGDFIARVDGHAEMPANYFREGAAILAARPEVWSVGGPMTRVGEGPAAELVAAVTSSVFSTGNTAVRVGDYEGAVDALGYPVWRREVFDRVGVFDEALVRNGDDDFDYRIRRAGGVIWQTPKMRAVYFVRSSPRRLVGQYIQYGFWKAVVARKHGRFFDWKPLAPLAFFGAIIILSAAGFVTPWLAAVGGALAASYLGADIFFAARVAARRGGRGFPSAFGLFPALHVGYALGMVEGFWAAYIRHMSAAEIRRRGVHCGLTR